MLAVRAIHFIIDQFKASLSMKKKLLIIVILVTVVGAGVWWWHD